MVPAAPPTSVPAVHPLHILIDSLECDDSAHEFRCLTQNMARKLYRSFRWLLASVTLLWAVEKTLSTSRDKLHIVESFRAPGRYHRRVRLDAEQTVEMSVRVNRAQPATANAINELKRRKIMIRQGTVHILLSVYIVLTLPALVLGQVYSIDASLALSRKSGRPIFAMAGNKT